METVDEKGGWRKKDGPSKDVAYRGDEPVCRNCRMVLGPSEI